MRYSITSSNLRNFQRIGKNVSIGKNGILNPLGILHIQQIFGLRRGPEYLYGLFDVLMFTQTDNMWNESTSSSSTSLQRLHSTMTSWGTGS